MLDGYQYEVTTNHLKSTTHLKCTKGTKRKIGKVFLEFQTVIVEGKISFNQDK